MSRSIVRVFPVLVLRLAVHHVAAVSVAGIIDRDVSATERPLVTSGVHRKPLVRSAGKQAVVAPRSVVRNATEKLGADVAMKARGTASQWFSSVEKEDYHQKPLVRSAGQQKRVAPKPVVPHTTAPHSAGVKHQDVALGLDARNALASSVGKQVVVAPRSVVRKVTEKLRAKSTKNTSVEHEEYHCKPYPGKRVVLVAVDADFIDFFDNWLAYAAPFLSSTEQLVVVAEDSIAEKELQRRRHDPNLHDFDVLHKEQSASLLADDEIDNAPAYGSKGYNLLMRSRPFHLYRFVRQGCAVLFVDVDTVWLRNPFKTIANTHGRFEHELYLIDDGANGGFPMFDHSMLARVKSKDHDCTATGKRTNFCGCFQFMRPTPAMVELAKAWTEAVWDPQYAREGNQHALNTILCKYFKGETTPPRTINLGVLPWNKFPPGSAIQWRHLEKDKTVVVHANWMAGHDTKKVWLKSGGWWKGITDWRR